MPSNNGNTKLPLPKITPRSPARPARSTDQLAAVVSGGRGETWAAAYAAALARPGEPVAAAPSGQPGSDLLQSGGPETAQVLRAKPQSAAAGHRRLLPAIAAAAPPGSVCGC